METGNPVHQTELGLPARINPFDGVEVAKLVAGCRGRRNFEDSLGDLHLHDAHAAGERLPRAVRRDGLELHRRRRPCARAAARRRSTAPSRCAAGSTPDLEYPSKRYGSTPHNGPAKGQAIGAQWEKMVDTWYAEVGYDRKTGKPLPKTLKALGLDWLAKELWGAKA